MKMIIFALALLMLIPVVEGTINVTCISSVNCLGDILNKVNDCSANGEQFYINTSVNCPDGCDSVAGRCNPPVEIDPNAYITETNRSCTDSSTLKIEKQEYKCIGSSCKWQNNTVYKFCDNGCYEGVTELGADCSPTQFNLLLYTMVFFFAFLLLTASFIKIKGKKKGRKWLR